MIDLKYIKGRDLLEFIAHYEEDESEDIVSDEIYGWDFDYDSQDLGNGLYSLYFEIEHGHVGRNNSIEINKNGDVSVRLDEPFEGGGGEEVIEAITKLYLKKLEVDLRDSKITSVIDSELELKDRYKAGILKKLEDLTKKIKSGEEMPHGEQTSELLSGIDETIEGVLNNWYY